MTRQRVYAAIGISLAVLMGVTLFLPAIAPNNPNVVTHDTVPTPNPIPTLPPPVTDFDGITFESVYLHPSGMYQITYPNGWTPTSPSNSETLVQVNFNNDQTQGVLETTIQTLDTPPTTLEELSDYLNSSFLQSTWRGYTSWNETARRIDEEAEQVVIDFELTLSQQNFLARHLAWLEDGRIYMVRSIAPENAVDYLRFMLENMVDSIEPVPLYVDGPGSWTAYHNPDDGYILRHPTSWFVSDGEPGVPVTMQSGDSVLRIETLPDNSIANEDAALSFVETLRPDAALGSAQAVTRSGGSGYLVSYQTANLDGEAISGGVLLLNAEAGDTLYTVDARVAGFTEDLNGEDGLSTRVSELGGILESFNLTDGLGLPAAEAEPEA